MTPFSFVLAQIRNPAITSTIEGETGVSFFGKFLPRLLTLIFVVGGIAFIFMFIIGAVRWILSGGDKSSVESARDQITQAVTGLVIMVSVWAITKLVENVFGINLLNVDLAPLLP